MKLRLVFPHVWAIASKKMMSSIMNAWMPCPRIMKCLRRYRCLRGPRCEGWPSISPQYLLWGPKIHLGCHQVVFMGLHLSNKASLFPALGLLLVKQLWNKPSLGSQCEIILIWAMNQLLPIKLCEGQLGGMLSPTVSFWWILKTISKSTNFLDPGGVLRYMSSTSVAKRLQLSMLHLFLPMYFFEWLGTYGVGAQSLGCWTTWREQHGF